MNTIFKGKSSLVILALLLLFASAQAYAQGPGNRFTVDFGANFGKLRMQGNEGGRELRVRGRTENSFVANSVGLNMAINYRLWERLDIFYNYHPEWANERGVEAIGFPCHDFGLRYQLLEWNNLFPYIKGSYTRYTLDNVRVYDPFRSPNGVTTFEYSWRGSGFTLGAGGEILMLDKLYWNIGFNRLFGVSKLKRIDEENTQIDFERRPRFFYWNFGIRWIL